MTKLATILCAVLVLSGCGGGSMSALAPAAVGGSQSSTPTKTNGSPPQPGTPTLPPGVTGNCATGLQFTAAGQTATIPITEENYTGAWTVTSSNTGVATASISGATLSITSVDNGSTFVTIKDSYGNTNGCNATVTVTTGTVS